MNIYLTQVGLKSLGFDPGPLDGLDGPRTQAAIREWKASREKDAPVRRSVNHAGLELIKHFEGCYLKAYKCPAGVWTIGYGHTGLTHRDGTVKPGRTITQAQAEDLLVHDLSKFAQRVESLVKVLLNDNQFSALVSFDFNTGALHKSTLLKKLNAGDYAGAADQLPRWNRAGGRALAGLTRRRKSERNLFLSTPPYIIL